MNFILFKKEIKSNYKILLLFMSVLTLYSTIIISMFDPKLGESLELMMQSMPELFSAFGMADTTSTLIDFAVNYLYGFLLIVFPMVFILVLVNKLLIKYTDSGSLSYILATPNKRSRIIFTQILFMLINIILLVLYVTVLCIITCEIMFPNELDTFAFIKTNISLVFLLFFISSICFMFACVFSDSKKATGFSVGICVYFILIQMISQVGEKFEYLKYFTPLTLFDAKSIAAGNQTAFALSFVLLSASVIVYVVSAVIFSKKDFCI